MDERAAIAPGLPQANPTNSYWQNPPADIANHQSTQTLPDYADFVIIGSGISGTSIAYHILSDQPDASVLLFEARQAASGATGRNGGHTKAASYRTFLGHMSALGRDEAVKIARFEYACMAALHDFIHCQKISCDARRCDTVDIIYDQGEWDQAIQAIESMRAIMGSDDVVARYTTWNAEETADKFLCERAVGGISYEAGSLSAYKLVVGILKLALEKGLNLQTNTPVDAVKEAANGESGQGKWLVQTKRGAVLANKLIIATNGYTAHLYPKLQGMIVPLRGHVSAHRPGKRMPENGLQTTYSFVYKSGYEYMISRPQGSDGAGDLIIGGGSMMAADGGMKEYGNTDDASINQDVVDYLKGTTVKYFGQNWGDDHPDGRIRAAWSGVMGYSADGLPLVGPVPGEMGLFISASFQGHGMVLCWLCAKALAQVLLGETDAAQDLLPNSFWVRAERMEAKFGGKMHSPRSMEPGQMDDHVDEARFSI